jgi:dihydrofolate synthase/folylpolyglutamate synthase
LNRSDDADRFSMNGYSRDDYEADGYEAGPESYDPWSELESRAAGETGADENDDISELSATPDGLSDSALRGEVVEHMLQPLVEDDEENEELSLIERAEEDIAASVLEAESASAAERVYESLLERVGESQPRPRIEPVRRFAQLAGMPQTQFPSIQVAGTNGKSSTSRAIESLLRAHGLHTGLFTSPHLVNFTERFQLDGEPVEGTVLERTWQDLQPALEMVDRELADQGNGPITFFEALAVLAFAAFADAPVDVAIIEVGMGGEWDATNIIDADVAVFTPIDLDHTQILGDTIEKIARTKAGIISSGSAVVSAKQQPAAAKELIEAAQQQDQTVVFVEDSGEILDDRVAVGGRLVHIRGITGQTYQPMLLPLFGAHQARNFLLAVAAVETFFGSERQIPDEVFETGTAQLTAPGRLQLINADPAIYIDAAHNPHGAAALAEAVKESFDFSELTLIFGAMGDKDAVGALKNLLPIADSVILVPVQSPRSLEEPELEDLARRLPNQAEVAYSLEEALDQARNWAASQEGRGVLVTGSVILAGQALTFAREEGW